MTIFFFYPAFAQKQGIERVDSLKATVSKIADDTTRIKTLVLISDAYKNINPDSGLKYAVQAVNKSKQIGWKKGVLRSLFTEGINHERRGKFEKALICFNGVLKVANELGDSVEIAKANSGLAFAYFTMGDITKALYHLHISIGLNERLNVKSQLPINYNLVGNIEISQRKFKEAIETFNKSRKAAYAVGDKTFVAYSYSNTAIALSELGQYSEAMEYMRKALATEIELEDTYGIATEYGSICDNYLKMYQSAVGDREHVYFLDSAILYAKKGIKLCIEIEDVQHEAYITNKLSIAYELKGDLKRALQAFRQARILEDSIFSQEKQNQIHQVELNQAANLKEKEIEIQSMQIQKGEHEKYVLLAGLLVLFVILVFIFRTLRRQKAMNKQLRETQSQLIQQEKLASLGELTAGIAHEIQNPLNFINNFSELNSELIVELKEELDKEKYDEVKAIAKDLIENEQKILHHGKRADAIVKGMLQHSRSSSGKKEPTDLNALADEYFRLAYHGLRAKDKSFNAKMESNFDEAIGQINIIPQDIGRVILNLLTNAFYAVKERQGSMKEQSGLNTYEPTVSISTKKFGDKIEVRISDNGNGIPQKVLDKIFQPFFTTKPTGHGTGLGLSLSYDIITNGHGGELKVETQEGEGTSFRIQLPIG